MIGLGLLNEATLKKVDLSFQTRGFLKLVDIFQEKVENAYSSQYNQPPINNVSPQKTKATVPYVGMQETEINNTSLGHASSTIRHNYEVKNGNQYLANLYDFYRDGQCIFTARCVQGIVTEVWDNRE